MDKKSRNERMKEFYKRKVERLEIKNDKLKFHISQLLVNTKDVSIEFLKQQIKFQVKDIS